MRDGCVEFARPAGAPDLALMVELDDRYVILSPLLQETAAQLRARGGKPVLEGFRYSSELNTEWLDGAALTRLIAVKAT